VAGYMKVPPYFNVL